MSGTNQQNWLPIGIGVTDNGVGCQNLLGAPFQFGAETYIMVRCATATDIASGSQGKLLTTSNTGTSAPSAFTGQAAQTAGPSWKVVLTTGLNEPLCCGMIPSQMTTVISGGSYFLALRDSPAHVGQVLQAVTGGAVGAISLGVFLKGTTGAVLAPVYTAVTTTTAALDDVIVGVRALGIGLEVVTGVAVVSATVAFHATFRAAL